MGDHRTYPAAERVVVERVREGMALRVYENSRTVHTEAVLNQEEAWAVAQSLANWTPFEEPKVPVGPKVPDYWPPKPGEQWRDSRGPGNLWVVVADGRLFCLGDDASEEAALGPKMLRTADMVHEKFGPLSRAAEALDLECPF